ncbi:hypothetical protein [Enterococcus sp. LJL90]
MKNYDSVKQGKRIINGVEVATTKISISNANILEVEVGTTGLKGGDSGHGGRSYLSFKDLGGTMMHGNIVQNGDDTEMIEIEFEGDSELETFIEGLEITLEILKDRR